VDGKSGVFRVVQGRARFQTVKVGPAANGQVEVVEGLSGGERLISASSGEVRDGERVKVEGEKS
jgi:multidrug efflux pump subunit AcrA (membrane-fusion protein)